MALNIAAAEDAATAEAADEDALSGQKSLASDPGMSSEYEADWTVTKRAAAAAGTSQ